MLEGRTNRTVRSIVSTHFSRTWVLDLGDESLGHVPLKSPSKIRISSFVPPSKIFVWGAYICWTISISNILSPPNEDLGRMNKRWNPDFRRSVKGVSTRFWLRTIEKYIENPDCIFCSSFPNLRLGEHKSFQNLRLGSIHFDKYFNLHIWLTLLSKWRLSNLLGWVAHAWFIQCRFTVRSMWN